MTTCEHDCPKASSGTLWSNWKTRMVWINAHFVLENFCISEFSGAVCRCISLNCSSTGYVKQMVDCYFNEGGIWSYSSGKIVCNHESSVLGLVKNYIFTYVCMGTILCSEHWRYYLRSLIAHVVNLESAPAWFMLILKLNSLMPPSLSENTELNGDNSSMLFGNLLRRYVAEVTLISLAKCFLLISVPALDNDVCLCLWNWRGA